MYLIIFLNFSANFTLYAIKNFASHSRIGEEAAIFATKFARNSFWTRQKPSRNLLIHGHFYFFLNEALPCQAKWMNSIRDPAKRFVSAFFFLRQRKRWIRKAKGSLPPFDYFNKSINSCILNHDPECDFSAGVFREQQLTYFCGNSPICREIGNKKALRMAKENVIKHYSAVGVLEHLITSLKMFSIELPEYFGNISGLERRRKLVKVKKNSNPNKRELVSSEAMKHLQRQMTLEYDFYYFVLNRLKKYKLES